MGNLNGCESIFIGDDEEKTKEKELKKEMKLPVTKTLVYYRRSDDFGWRMYKVLTWKIAERIADWYTLEIEVEGLGKVKIHHAFLAQMQKPTFVKDMQKTLNGEEEETDES